MIAYQNYKHCDEVEQPKAQFNRKKKAVVGDDEWTTARCRKDQEEDKDIGALLRWKEDGIERPGWSEISPFFKALLAQWNSLRVENGFPKRAWESPDGRHVTLQLVVPAIRIKEELQEMHDGGSSAHLAINKKLSKVRERFYWVRYREHVESWCKNYRTCAAVKRPKIKSIVPLQPQKVGAPFGRTAGDIAGHHPVTEKGSKYRKNVKGYHDGLWLTGEAAERSRNAAPQE